jgi:hypothetical protein
VIKGATDNAAYLMNKAFTSGSWNVVDLDLPNSGGDPDLSNVTLFGTAPLAPVPVPAAGFLLIGALGGLVSRGAWKQSVLAAARKKAAGETLDVAETQLLKKAAALGGATAAATANSLQMGASDIYGELREQGAGADDFAAVVEFKAGCDNGKVDGLVVRTHASAAGYIAGVRLKGASDNIEIKNCNMNMVGAGLVAGINADTTLSTNVLIHDNVLVMDAEPGIEVITNTTGVAWNNFIAADLASLAAAIVGAGGGHLLYLFNNQNCEVPTETGGVIGTASVDD